MEAYVWRPPVAAESSAERRRRLQWDRLLARYALRSGTALWWEEAYADLARARADAAAEEARRRAAEARRELARATTHAPGWRDLDDLLDRHTDPRGTCSALGLKWWPAAGRGCKVLCPVHDDRSPSTSVSVGRDGRLRVRCFSCGWHGALTDLVAVVRGLSLPRDLPAVLAEIDAL